MSTGKSIEELLEGFEQNGVTFGNIKGLIATLRLAIEQTDTWRKLAHKSEESAAISKENDEHELVLMLEGEE